MHVTATNNQTYTPFPINDLGEIREYLPAKVNGIALLLLDFDDTMVMTGHACAGHLGGLRWRDMLRKTIQHLKKEKEIKQGAPLFEYLTLFIAKSARVAAVQPGITPALIADLQQRGLKVMVFTARGRNGKNAWYQLPISGVDELTEQQMLAAGIQLAQSKLPTHPKIYKHSMIFTQNTPKEEVIKDLFDKNVFQSSDIALLAFADDKADAVKKVQQYAEDQRLPFIGFHYTAVEKAEANEFDLLKSTIQLVNLFATGHFLKAEELEAKEKEFTSNQTMTPENYFDEVIKKVDCILEENNLYSPSRDTDHFYQRVAPALKSAFSNHLQCSKL